MEDHLDLASPATYRDGLPHAYFARLRREEPVSFQREASGPGFWAVTRHADVSHVLRTPAIFSSHRGGCRLEDLPLPFLEKMRENMMNTDPPRHDQLRDLTRGVFSPKRVRSLTDRVAAKAAAIVDGLVGREPCDFATELAGELPLFVICEILGVPSSDRAHLYALTNRMFASTSEDRAAAMRDSMAAAEEMRAYALTLARSRGTWRSDDLIGDLMRAEIDGRRLTEGEISAFFMLLFNAGADTTRSALCFGASLLARSRGALGALHETPALVETAVEEILRFETVVIQFRRTALAPTRLGETDIAEGDKVVVFFPSANRDESVFDAPDTFDVRRSPNPHLAFGHGTHFCLGAPLARLEMASLLRALAARADDVALDGKPTFGATNFVRSVHRQPVRLSWR